MTLYDFIFSSKNSIRVKRHLAFWGAYSIFLFNRMFAIEEIKDFLKFEHYKFALERMVLWLPICVFSVTIFENVLVPRFLLKKKYFHFGIASLSVFAINMALAYCSARLYYNYIFEAEANYRPPPDLELKGTAWLIYFHGIVLAGGISVLAVGIKFGKFLYLQEIENTRLVKEKNANEVKIIKGSIQPAFLLRSLSSVYAKVHNKDPYAPYVILSLSELLSYILYDSSEPIVPLKTEIEMTLSSIEMEKINPENHVELLLEINGKVEDKFVTPLQLFTQVQHIMQQISIVKNKQSVLINIDVGNDFINIQLPRNLVDFDFMHNIQGLTNKNETMTWEKGIEYKLLPVNNMQITK